MVGVQVSEEYAIKTGGGLASRRGGREGADPVSSRRCGPTDNARTSIEQVGYRVDHYCNRGSAAIRVGYWCPCAEHHDLSARLLSGDSRGSERQQEEKNGEA